MTTLFHKNQFNPDSAGETEQYIQEMKDLERQFSLIRWLGVVSIFILAWLHDPVSTLAMIILGGILGLYNAVACIFRPRINRRETQRALSIVLLTLDAIVIWGVISLFVRDFYTAAYVAFTLVILEGALRFGLAGGLAMAFVFALGLVGAQIFRKVEYDVRFSISGYIFWTLLMILIAVSVGKVTDQARRNRQQSDRLIKERVMMLERKRFSNEMHDTVLKTLQGLALQARALQDKASAASEVKQTAQYIEKVCKRSGKEIRDAVLDLRSKDPELSIGLQLSQVVDGWSKDTGIACEFALRGNDKIVSPRIGHNLCRILEEALANIHKHTSASHVGVSMSILSDELSLEVSDNGCGLNVDTRDISSLVSSGKLGIVTMKERAEQLRGQLSINGSSSGTRVSVSIPLTGQDSSGDEIWNP